MIATAVSRCRASAWSPERVARAAASSGVIPFVNRRQAVSVLILTSAAGGSSGGLGRLTNSPQARVSDLSSAWHSARTTDQTPPPSPSIASVIVVPAGASTVRNVCGSARTNVARTGPIQRASSSSGLPTASRICCWWPQC